jgi:hypothetical protein
MTKNEILNEIEDLQQAFTDIQSTERYYALQMLKDRILTFNTKEK